MKRSCWLLAALVLVCALAPAGCSSGARVTKVLVALNDEKGKPLTDAEVRLVPKDDPGLGEGCTGMTAADGKVELIPDPKKPMKPGRYVVLVRKLVGKDNAPFKQVGADDIAVRPSSEGAAHNLLPDLYSDPRRSPLIVTLTAGDNTVPLDLKKQ
jgi:hypothetical protein